jgi:predicted small metal-binding protein
VEWTLGCECGHVARGEDEEGLVAAVQLHARDVHGLELSSQQVLRSVRRPREEAAGRDQRSQDAGTQTA